MAGFRERIEVLVELLSRDKASKDLDSVADKADKLDKKTATVEVTADADDARGDIDRVEDELRRLDGEAAKVNIDSSGADEFASAIGSIPGPLGAITGALGTGGTVAGGVGVIATGLFAAADSAADLAIEAKTTSQLTGDTVEDASRLQAVWQTSGADINDLNDVLLQMHGVLSDQPELAKQLGMNLNDGRTIGERFRDAVQMVGDGLIDARTQSQLFGEEGVRQVARLTTVVNGDLQGALDGVADTRVISDADVDAAVEFSQTMAELKMQVGAVAQELGQSLIPAITEMAKAANTPVGDTSFMGMVSNNVFSSSLKGVNSALDYLFRDREYIFDEFTGGDFESGMSDAATAALGVAAAAVRAGEAVGNTRERLSDAGEAAQMLAERQLAALEEAAGGAEDAANDLTSALDDVFGSAVDLQGASDELASNFQELEQSIKDNGKSLDVNTEKGRANREQVRQSVSGIQDYIGKLIESGASSEQAGNEYAMLRQQLVNQARQFGMTEAEAADYINRLGLTPDSVTTAVNLANVDRARELIRQHIERVGAIPADKLTSIMTDADTGELDRVKRSLATLERNVIVRVQTQATGGAYVPPGVNQARAKGGPVKAGDPYLVGEEGPELMVPGQSGTVIPNDALTSRTGGTPVGAGGGVTFNMPVTINAGMGANGAMIAREFENALAATARTIGKDKLRRLLGI